MADGTEAGGAAALTLDAVKGAGKPGLARALAALERSGAAPAVAALLDAAYDAPVGHVLGLTGPPGVGKSTLVNRLIALWRGRGETVGVIAVDPTSRATGGALLGDRTRFKTDPEDQGVFVRSMAAREALGGLAELTFPATVLMRALFDHVIVETVGVGQSETDVGQVADTVAFCIQPGSGDSLQFMKAGIMEVPDLFVVTKADLGTPAQKAVADVEGALSLAAGRGDWTPPVLSVSADRHAGLDAFVDAVAAHARSLAAPAEALATRRAAQARAWLMAAVRARFGSAGAALMDPAALDARTDRFFTARTSLLASLDVVRTDG
ncbi:ArgK/MeaB family GTPase [Rhodothalassium salexigens]|uniref:ArgK/MeaB family GTPase n=1 Tax=Rhodothalassium salexigens TaxID=1086 RepID=UPI001912746B|nr:methylmalonyl Co-A mutase-associated GTPase MeaB [Rhodothalassium salexigens]